MRIDDLPDDFGPEDFMKLSKSDLDILPYDVLKWECCFKDCKNGTTVRDYGIAPNYFLNRNSKAADKSPNKYWHNTSNIVWFCGKHYPYMKRLGMEYTFQRFCKYKRPSPRIIKQVNQNIEKINS
ncbi:hypothetical protein [Elizabethkingia miricola]|uniref:hypothetical protein n=1 Tax=Elizabethkingia miricola TaxID=172045 RepID=UPI00099A375B|nr:hypothetical protein [Elizabethkingia miricola]OPC36170.1 hypothetical protein BAX99_19120 [Elizabethkingia miricola]